MTPAPNPGSRQWPHLCPIQLNQLVNWWTLQKDNWSMGIDLLIFFQNDVNNFASGSIGDVEISVNFVSPTGTLHRQMAMAAWPVEDRCRPTLQRLVAEDSHCVNPVPAYDINNRLIPPKDYARHLSGAIVEVHFVLVHHHIDNRNRSTLTAELRKLHILRPPQQVENPMKRKQCATASTPESWRHQWYNEHAKGT